MRFKAAYIGECLLTAIEHRALSDVNLREVARAECQNAGVPADGITIGIWDDAEEDAATVRPMTIDGPTIIAGGDMASDLFDGETFTVDETIALLAENLNYEGRAGYQGWGHVLEAPDGSLVSVSD